MGLTLPAAFGNQDVSDIIRKAIRAKDPYGK
jgi:hypothetical protein